jgi:RHS repeat-associated protein
VAGLPAAAIESSDVAANTMDLYNGNIKAMQTTLTHPVTQELMPMANAYRYDQLNRLLESRSFINLTGNQWGASGMYDNRYLNTFEYDAMGNILHQNRYTAAGVQIENMSYGYKKDNNGNLLRNRLYQINDFVDSQTDLTDIDDMDGDLSQDLFNPQDANIETAYNYAYDEEGRLIRDVQEKIDQIVWRVDGKVKEIHRPADSGKKNLSFDYDAMGNRIAKHVYDDDWNLEKSTYYILDAQGNQLNVYEHEVLNSTVTYSLKERHIYGSSMLGMYTDSVSMYAASDQQNTTFESGQKYYSMSNHLGNVLTVVSDLKIPQTTNTVTVSGYQAQIVNVSDFSGFGVELDGRTIKNGDFRYGFQGQESDDEVKGDGNSVNYKYRMHDPRIGRFFAVDPLAGKYPFYSPYAFSGNRVIDCVELEGLEPADAKQGADVLVIVVLGYGNEPQKGETQYKNDTKKDPNDTDISNGSSEVGLTSIETHFASNPKAQIVVFSSADNEDKTVADVGKTMHNFIDANPNGKIILVGHSMGGDNIVNAANNNKDIPIELLYTIDICDDIGNWDDDNIPSNVSYHINVYQDNSVAGGEDTEIDNPNKTTGFNYFAQDNNVSHTNVDNMYAKKVINRISRVLDSLKPLTDKEIENVKENK